MSADWTPPAEAVEAAVSALLESDAMTPNDEGTPTHYFVDAENDEYLVGIVLIAAYPAIVAEKDAEIERVRDELREEFARGMDLDGALVDVRIALKEAREKLAAVAALVASLPHVGECRLPDEPRSCRTIGFREAIAAALADQTEES